MAEQININEQDYLTSRLDDQINWFDRKASWNQSWYKRLKVIEIIFAASIPFLTSYIATEIVASDAQQNASQLLSLDPNNLLKIVVGFFGLSIAVISGILSLHKFQENWVEYRHSCEALRKEKYLYITRVEPYNIDKPFPLLVKRVEGLLLNETDQWTQYIRQVSDPT